MKTKVIGIVLLVAGCAAAPITDAETAQLMRIQKIAPLCVAQGMTNDTGAMAYAQNRASQILSRATAEQKSRVASSYAGTISAPPTPRACAVVAVDALGAQQQQQVQMQQQAIQNQQWANINAQNQQMMNNRPRMTTCTHMRWGNMTTCNSY